MGRQRVVIVGGGFGGLLAAQALARADVEVTLIDRRNFHLFQPLLYQVATGGLSPANISAPLRGLLKRQANATVLLGNVVDFEVAERRVVLEDGKAIPYDNLIVAAGSMTHYFNHPEWKVAAPGLKTIADATDIRKRVLSAFEAAELTTDPEIRRAALTFVVIGGGASGVELAGAVSELAHRTLTRLFRHFDPNSARVLLVEGADRILNSFPEKLSGKAVEALKSLGVEVQTGAKVTDVDEHSVTLQHGDKTERIETRTILWAAGVHGSPLGRLLAQKLGAEVDKQGRVTVQNDLTLTGHPEILVIGDLARFDHQDGKPLPGVAQTAMQQGDYAAKLIQARLRGKALPPFRYHDRGSMAVIGRNDAIADLGWIQLSGIPARIIWLFVHLVSLLQLQNKTLVLIQWIWSSLTRNRSALLIPEGETEKVDRAGKGD